MSRVERLYDRGALRGTGNPNGVVNASFGDTYFDIASTTQYICTAFPIGNVWQVI